MPVGTDLNVERLWKIQGAAQTIRKDRFFPGLSLCILAKTGTADEFTSSDSLDLLDLEPLRKSTNMGPTELLGPTPSLSWPFLLDTPRMLSLRSAASRTYGR